MTIEAAAGEAPADDDTKAASEAAVLSQEPDDEEAVARGQGWVPQDEWKGKPENWKPAKTYVEHGDLKSRLAKTEDTLKRVGKTTEKAIEALKKQHDREIAELKAGKTEAVKKGDVKAVEAYDAAIDEAKANAPGKETATDDESVEAEFKSRNAWYETDEELTALAERYSRTVAAEYHDKNKEPMPFDLNLKEVEKRVKASALWKSKTKPAANGHAAVDGGGESPAPRKPGKTAADLPSDVREIGMQLVKAGGFKDIEAYAKEYHKNA